MTKKTAYVIGSFTNSQVRDMVMDLRDCGYEPQTFRSNGEVIENNISMPDLVVTKEKKHLPDVETITPEELQKRAGRTSQMTL